MRLEQIATIHAGYPFRGKIPETADSSVVVVQMKDISLTEGICWTNCLHTELNGKRESDCLTVGDILVAARGNHNYATHVDQTLIATRKQAVAAPHFFIVRLKNQGILPEFVTWLLNQTPVQRYFEQSAEGSVTKSIRRSVLENAPIAIPSLAKQNAIVAVAHTLRKEQQLMQQLVHNAERMMSALTNDLYHANHKQV